jgi:hypothetical protein
VRSKPCLPTHDANRHTPAVLLAPREPKCKHAALPRPSRELDHLRVAQVRSDAQLERRHEWLRRAHGRRELPDVRWREVQDLRMPLNLRDSQQGRDNKGVELPRASHAGRTPSGLPTVHGRGRSAVAQHRCSYMRGTRGGTSQWPLRPR